MASFSQIVGQENIIEHFQRAIREDMVSHSYIINGEEHSGKMLLAESFAKALQCSEERENGCGKCQSCRQAESHNHPDILYVTHEKTVISVDDIRRQIVATMEIKPYSAAYKIYLVDEADKMNEQAQNALLKTIEEPPAYGIVLLLTTNLNRLLPTILSRCTVLQIKPVSAEKISGHLMESLKVPDYNAHVAAAFAQGNVGKAVHFATSETFAARKADVVDLVKRLPGIRMIELLGRVKEWSGQKKEINDILDFMLLWYRDLLLYKSTAKEKLLLYREEKEAVRQQAEQIAYEGLNRCLQILEEARARFRANVNFEITLEMMLVGLKDQFSMEG